MCARIREAARRLEHGPSPALVARRCGAFFAALAEDFNTPRALAAVFEWVSEANRAGGERPATPTCARCLTSSASPICSIADDAEAPSEVLELRDARERARAARDYAEADRLRDELRARGWEVRDGPGGPELLPRQ